MCPITKNERKVGKMCVKSPSEDLKEWAEHAYSNKSTWLGEASGDSASRKRYIIRKLYKYYSTDEGGTVLGGSYDDFIGTLKVIEDSGESGEKFTVYPQNRKMNGVTVDKVGAMDECLNRYREWKDKLDNMFAYRVYVGNTIKTDKAGGDTLSRITLRLVPEKALDVFKTVATEIVGSSDSRFEHVKQAKVMGPAKIGTSTDSMVIYLTSKDYSEIVEHLTTSFDESYFRDGKPLTMLHVEKGISYAERAPPGQPGSHGKSRALPIAEAVLETETKPVSDSTEFLERVKEKLKARGIDPENPHKNL
jgi:hypothetical protein